VDITADVYPYPYWQSTLTVLFPKRDFADRQEAERILREIAPADGLRLGAYAPTPAYRGKTVAEIAALRREPPAVTLMTLIADALAWEQAHPDSNESSENVIATSMRESDIAKLYAWPHTNVSSDGALDGAHPRGFGSFPRVFAEYVRRTPVLTVEAAVHRMTALAAAHVGITKRGTIAPGAFADLVLFDPATITDHATPADPHRLSTGIRAVWVNGQVVFRDGVTTGVYPGRVLRRVTTAAAP
jgi:N-acyl-D-amino-acid deacylase